MRSHETCLRMHLDTMLQRQQTADEQRRRLLEEALA